MTLDELLTAARAAGPWTRRRQGARLLRNPNGECPICAVANARIGRHTFENYHVMRAARWLGLDPTLAVEVATTADNKHGARAEVREAVLALAREAAR